MLEPREGLSLDGEPNIISVDEILKEYGIKGLTLEELQEKYVNDSDADWERYSELEEKYEALNTHIDQLSEEISDLTTAIEELEYNVNFNKDASNSNSASFIFIIIVLIIALLYVISNKKEN